MLGRNLRGWREGQDFCLDLFGPAPTYTNLRRICQDPHHAMHANPTIQLASLLIAGRVTLRRQPVLMSASSARAPAGLMVPVELATRLPQELRRATRPPKDTTSMMTGVLRFVLWAWCALKAPRLRRWTLCPAGIGSARRARSRGSAPPRTPRIVLAATAARMRFVLRGLVAPYAQYARRLTSPATRWADASLARRRMRGLDRS